MNDLRRMLAEASRPVLVAQPEYGLTLSSGSKRNHGTTGSQRHRATMLLVVILAFCWFQIGQAPEASAQAVSQYHGLLVSSFVSPFTSISAPNRPSCYSPPKSFHADLDQVVTALNASPYRGVAVPLVRDEDTCSHQFADFQPAIDRIKKQLASGKDVWPWIFLDRIIGYDVDAGSAHAGQEVLPYYQRIKGMDVTGQSQARNDFYLLFRYGLRAAKQLGSPGIVLDMEAYNNYRSQGLPALSRYTGQQEDTLKNKLQAMGSDLAGIAAQEYPNAVIWIYWTGLTDVYVPSQKDPSYRAQSYIVRGLLNAANSRGLALRVVSGGELIGGYCQPSLKAMQETINERKRAFAPLQAQYPNLYLGGTLTLWLTPQSRKGWLLKGKCGDAAGEDAHQLKDMVAELNKSYAYVWIYANGASDYNPYVEKDASQMNAILRQMF
jgi:hypothetical protein